MPPDARLMTIKKGNTMLVEVRKVVNATIGRFSRTKKLASSHHMLLS